MKHKKETSILQLHTLWVRMWDFICELIEGIDGDEVQAAIKTVKNGEHPFWEKLAEAFKELRHKLECELMPSAWVLCEKEGNTDAEVLRSFESTASRSGFLIELDPGCVHLGRHPPVRTVIRFVRFNQGLSVCEALDALLENRYVPASPHLALRLVRDYCQRRTPRPFKELVGFHESIAFIDRTDPDLSLAILHQAHERHKLVTVKDYWPADASYCAVVAVIDTSSTH